MSLHRIEDEGPANNVTVRAQYGGVRLVLQVSILALLLFFGGYIVLYMDRHNDERYVTRIEYSRDRETDKELRTANQGALTFRLDAQDKKLEEISRDVKSLLSRGSDR